VNQVISTSCSAPTVRQTGGLIMISELGESGDPVKIREIPART
jgi:hypothetical protein